MAKLFTSFYKRLPVRRSHTDNRLDLLTDEEIRHIRRSERWLIVAAAVLSVAGFLGYYLPIYKFPYLFPSVGFVIPLTSSVFELPWASLVWCVLLTSIELILLTFLNIAGAHEIAVATGFINAESKTEKSETLLGIGLERKATEVMRYGIDPFQDLNRWSLFLFNTLLRLKGWLASKVIRSLTRLLLGRYAVRTVLDFSGMPLYMAINAYSVHKVLREARVIIIGQTVITRLIARLPRRELTATEKELLYDTLQYIAVSKRDFHGNHYLLTRELLDLFSIPYKERHPLPADYLDKLHQSPARAMALCQIVILLGFILDGNISRRERTRLEELNSRGILRESLSELRRYRLDFVNGRGVDFWLEAYLSRIGETSDRVAADFQATIESV